MGSAQQSWAQQQSQPQSPSATSGEAGKPQAPPQPANEEKAWSEASQAGTVTALNQYLQEHGNGAHSGEARQRLAALEQARKDA